jgi:CubicO group peptidase (beta-lactamase class C family)
MVTRRDMLMMGLAAPLLAACGGGSSGPDVPRPRLPDGEDVTPTNIAADDWPTATPESQAIPAAAMTRFLNDGQAVTGLRSLLVVRNGMLVGERYYNGALSSDLQHVRSATKSVSSLLIGQAIADGRISGTSATVRQLLPREMAQVPNSKVGEVTLLGILQMRGGLAFNDAGRSNDLNTTPNLTLLTLGLQPTGEFNWNYDSASSHLPSAIVAHARGASNVLTSATATLFEPLGIKQVQWNADASGTNYGSFGLKMRSRDFMKIGWMSLDGGRWQGRQVVPTEWLKQSMTSHVRLGDDGDMENIGYGYLWWSGILGSRPVWVAYGHGGQLAILVPSLNMVVVSTARWHVEYGPADEVEGRIHTLVTQLISTIVFG